MLFCTTPFLWFFLVVFAAYWAIPGQRAGVGLLLAASAYFYARWNPMLAGLVFFTSTLDFLLARWIEGAASPRRKRWLLGVSLAVNLGLLGYLKYANFFLRSVEGTAHTLGFEPALPVLKVILPIGISFYTFEAISYVMDVYAGRVKAERSLPNFLLFILFFPHLVAGPIVRARDFLPQVEWKKRWSWRRAEVGLLLVALGLIKKLAVADRLALYVDLTFGTPAAYDTWTLWLAAVAYSFQIYCDFSGYSDMALGLAHLLGYHLARNFDRPFVAASVSELWRRWHISLSNWFRDYVFRPLGGNQGGGWRTLRNLLLVMALSGLWHGAGWTFVVWGVVHGVLLIGHRLFRGWSERHPRLRAALESAPGRAGCVALTFLSFVLSFVIFRATTLQLAGVMLGRMFSSCPGATFALNPWSLYLTLALAMLVHAAGTPTRVVRLWKRLPQPVQGLAYGSAVAFAVMLAPPVDRAFIYFQF